MLIRTAIRALNRRTRHLGKGFIFNILNRFSEGWNDWSFGRSWTLSAGTQSR
jgi:hypothetical protein